MSHTIVANIRESVDVDIDENNRPVVNDRYAECWECGGTSRNRPEQDYITWAYDHADTCR